MAHKKAAGSVKNLKDSQPKYRGVKVFGGQPVVAGNIIIRQKGSKYECGKNTYEAADFTILAKTDGIVAFKKKNFKKFNGRTYLKTVVEVVSVEESAKKAPAKKVEKAEKVAKAPAKKAAAPKKAPAKKVEKAEKVVKAPAKKAAAPKKAPAKKAEKAEKVAKAPAKKAAAPKKAPAKKAEKAE